MSGSNRVRRVEWKNVGAFTLVEVLLASAILAMVLTGIYASWTSILRGSKVGLDAAAEAQRTRTALRAIEEALSSAQLYSGNIRYYSFLADTSKDFAELSFVSRLPASFPGSGLFGEQVVRRVWFLVEQNAKGKNQLVLKQTPLLEAPESDAKPYSIVLAPNVNIFAIEFLDTNRWEWVSEWLYTNRLPKMARVAVSFGEKRHGPAKPEDTTIQTVLLSSAAIPRELQLPPGRAIGGPMINPLTGQPLPPGGVLPQPVGPGSPNPNLRTPATPRR